MKAMWKFLSLIALCLSHIVNVKSELMCHQRGDYCEVKEPEVTKVAGICFLLQNKILFLNINK